MTKEEIIKIAIYGTRDDILSSIEDKFYRSQILKLTSEYDFDSNTLLSEIEEYNLHLKTL